MREIHSFAFVVNRGQSNDPKDHECASSDCESLSFTEDVAEQRLVVGPRPLTPHLTHLTFNRHNSPSCLFFGFLHSRLSRIPSVSARFPPAVTLQPAAWSYSTTAVDLRLTNGEGAHEQRCE